MFSPKILHGVLILAGFCLQNHGTFAAPTTVPGISPLENPDFVKKEIHLLQAGDENERTKARQELKFVGAQCIPYLLEEGSIASIQAAYDFGYFESFSEEQKRRLCLALILQEGDKWGGRIFISSDYYLSGTSGFGREQWARYILENQSYFYPKITGAWERVPRVREIVAFWGLDKDKILKIIQAQGDLRECENALWPYRDPLIAEYAWVNLRGETRDRILLWTVGAAVRLTALQRGESQSLDDRDLREAAYLEKWKQFMKVHDLKNLAEWKEVSKKEAVETLQKFVRQKNKLLSWMDPNAQGETVEPEDPRYLLYPEEAAAMQTLVYQMDVGSIPLLSSVKSVFEEINFSPGPGTGRRSNAEALAALAEESIRRLNSANPLLPAPEVPKKLPVWKLSAEVRYKKIRQAILDGLHAGPISCHSIDDYVYENLERECGGIPPSVRVKLATEDNPIIRAFIQESLK